MTVLSAVLVAVSSFAQADTIPHFVLNQGTVLATPAQDVIGNIHFLLSGTSASISGVGTVGGDCGFCVTGPPGGTVLTPFIGIPCCGAAGSITIGSTTYTGVLFQGGVTATGTSFTLPPLSGKDGNVFRITLPVIFTGSITGCPGVLSEGDFGCTGPDIASFSFAKSGKVVLEFVEDGGGWFWNSAEYKLAPVPEPGTLALLGTGAMALAGRWLRRKNTNTQI